jgi:hypothetical protein
MRAIEARHLIVVERDTGRIVGAGGDPDEKSQSRRRQLCGMPTSRQPFFDLRIVEEADFNWILRSDWRKLRLSSGHLKRMPVWRDRLVEVGGDDACN